MARHIKKGDTVQVISGDHKGSTGEVMRMLVDKDRVLIKGVNLVFKHVKPSRKNPQGGRIRIEKPIHVSNVLPVSKAAKGQHVHFETDGKGLKRRIAKDGTDLGIVGKKK
jgi:large subunit ribosomal protein L24